MNEGGRNLERDIMDSFFEEVDRDDSIPDDLVDELKRLERQNELADATRVIEATEEVRSDAHSED